MPAGQFTKVIHLKLEVNYFGEQELTVGGRKNKSHDLYGHLEGTSTKVFITFLSFFPLFSLSFLSV